MPRIPYLDPDRVTDPWLAERLRTEIAQRGRVAGSTALLGRRSALARAWRGVFAANAESGLLERPLRHLVNRRVAMTVGCGY